MSNVWKIGSRWGYPGTSVLDLFIGYGCVFFNTEGNPKYNRYKDVKSGDMFVVADGETAVGIGKALSSFSSYEESGIVFTHDDWDNYINGTNTLICKVSIILFAKEDNVQLGGVNRSRFSEYRPHDTAQRAYVVECWEKFQEAKSQGAFNIDSGTYSLLYSEKNQLRQAIFSKDRQYQIPIYQRPYSWNDGNLRRLMEDLRDSVKNQEPVFMGTIQLSEPIPLNPSGTKNAYDVIDGQQRITSFIILLGILGMLPDYVKKTRTLVNRGQAQSDLDKLWTFLKDQSSNNNQLKTINPYIQNALILKALLAELFDGNEDAPNQDELKEFLRTKILFVVIETHAGLSKTLKIFNTINTAGMDLGAEDLFKIRFYEYLKQCNEPDEVFDCISNVYARVEQRIKEKRQGAPGMDSLLSTYQRVLIAKYDLPAETFNMGYERFYDQLFDTLLNIREWPAFGKIKKDRNNFKMSTNDLNILLNCFETRSDLLSSNSDFKIINSFLWETRYGGQIWNLGVIALFFEAINESQLYDLTLAAFKMSCSPSLFYAKRVNGIVSLLIDYLKQDIAKGDKSINPLESLVKRFKTYRDYKENIGVEIMLQKAFENDIISYPKWKNLICRLVEYLASDNKDEALYNRLFDIPIDIEHIQCFTDKKDAEGIRKAWGDELNRLGNLVILEREINQSIHNNAEVKPAQYLTSAFESVKRLAGKVGVENKQSRWTKENAEQRREENSKLLFNFIFS